jgi:arginyl-tRNA synthetase
MKPMDIAKIIIEHMPAIPEVQSVTAAPPGFINFKLSSSWLTELVSRILEQGEDYGNGILGKGTRVQIEFVSANPTGPLHLGNGRGAVLGSALASVLAAAGYTVEKEYYFNDAGNQMQAFYNSLYCRYQQGFGKEAEMPENGYHGSYMVELAKKITDEQGEKYLSMPEAEGKAALGAIGLKKVMDWIKDDLKKLGVTFDVFYSEQTLYKQGQFKHAMQLLQDRGFIAQRENATWFTSTALGEDKDNVVIRSDGTPTYFGADIAYHYNKFFERHFDRVIDIWGADHQGHVTRMKAVIAALGGKAENLDILISQMVTLRRGQETVRISKRTGDMITLREVIDEVGMDACRFFFMSRTADSQMDFDLELAKKEGNENPVYYIQYAHTRMCSIIRKAAEEQGITDFSDGDTSLLTREAELSLIRKLAMFPEVVETAAATLAPHHLTYYAQELATVWTVFYHDPDCHVLSDDLRLTKARLKLVTAAKNVLARSLHLMGMTSPEKM